MVGIHPPAKSGRGSPDTTLNLIAANKLKSVIDFGVGGGTELSGIIEGLKKRKYHLDTAEANEVNEDFIKQASKLFGIKNQDVLIHRANWLNLPQADPPYTNVFDFGFLTGNSLTYIGGGTREYTKKAQQIVVNKFAQLIKKGGYLFIDTRNYDYIKSLMNLPKEKIFENFSFDYSVIMTHKKKNGSNLTYTRFTKRTC